MNSTNTALPSVAIDTTGDLRGAASSRDTTSSPRVRQEMSPRFVGVIGAVLMFACLMAFALRTYSALP